VPEVAGGFPKLARNTLRLRAAVILPRDDPNTERRNMLIGILSWVISGVVVAFIASRVVNLHGDDPRLGIALGGGGGLIGGWLYSVVSGSHVSAFNPWRLLFAVALALALVLVWHYIRSRGPHERPSFRRSY
jgi:uncharacterized membrane protein YeaQ/YmgE (transglycosylase-associated protein family)